MADSTSAVPRAPAPDADLERAETFTKEPFLLEGEDAAVALAAGTPRRQALDAALAELADGRDQPSPDWRREFSLMLGLERLVAQEEPHLVDGTVLSSHQVDALSGTLVALLAERQAGARNGSGTNGSSPGGELHSGQEELEGDDELTEEEEPLDWD